ncbi:uncharacterized protein SAPINGB_P004545 [Magnusiomyces paraingens]|uniref:UTP23 sensor motif region domain-containing protein n=1 Tax=Magnusiomyces paraingens TaxID=2606893 RepID=A0A5E8C2I0_9ASCO|nr:uncharacterized protein SAPINGB_P004545 [Saprochaete ingens]VVT55335.1 unnamed protein product [Saprochaete ingens]
MRQKRMKSYRKQMQYLQVNFKFREPYQILLDDQIILESVKNKQDLVKALERAAQGKIKPMVTQCTMEALYKTQNQEAIELAKSFERRKCGHFPPSSLSEASKKKKFDDDGKVIGAKEKPEETKDEEAKTNNETKPNKKGKKDKKKDDKDMPDPNATKTPSACLWTVVAVDKTFNKHRYLVGSQDFRLRARLRVIPAVPLLYINRAVMVMEPMSEATTKMREAIENAKLTGGLNKLPAGIAPLPQKRKAGEGDDESEEKDGDGSTAAEEPAKKKKKGPKGPHPLSVLKKKKKPTVKHEPEPESEPKKEETEGEGEKKKRRRKHHGGSKKENGEEQSKKIEDDATTEPN